eukprot:c25734_g1_i1 orf=304-1542(+)
MLSNCSDGLVACFLSINEEALQLADWVTHTMENHSSCGLHEDLGCRDTYLALELKLGAIITVLVASAIGVALPLLGRRVKWFKSDGTFFVVAKAFAAGVILATGFVHMLPDAMESLTSECLPKNPWRNFPFSGFISMVAALGTLMVDVLATEHYERKHSQKQIGDEEWISPEKERIDLASSSIETGSDKETHALEHSHGDCIHIVGVRAHAASHGHSHPLGHHSCSDNTHEHVHGKFGHSHMSLSHSEDTLTHVRHVVVSQVLELGIITHSVIIGISLGVSQSPCIIRPLLAALSFHQFFEGFALGGCISQAGFKSLSSVLMSLSFAVTTPMGIGIGIGIASNLTSYSPRAIVVEGIFDSISAGILVYMALVDLIAADFLNKRMRCNRSLQVTSYIALFLGAASMSAVAVWI